MRDPRHTSEHTPVGSGIQQREFDRCGSPTGPNDHLACVYDDRDEQFATAVPFVRAGLARGERCLYLVDDNATEDVVEAMAAAGIDVAAAREADLLAVRPAAETGLDPDASECPDAATVREEFVTGPDGKAFERVRIVCEMTWALGDDRRSTRDALASYEAMLDRSCSDEVLTGLCLYSRDRFSREVLRGAVHTHPQLVVDGERCQNFFYVPPERWFDGQSRTRFDRRLRSLRDRLDLKVGGREGEVEREEPGPTHGTVAEASRELRSFDPATLARQAVANAQAVLDARRVAVCRYERETGTLVPRATATDDFEPDRFADGLWEAFAANETRVLGSGEERPAADVVVVPLGRHGVFVAAPDEGAVVDGDEATEGHRPPDAVDFVETVAANVRCAFDRAEREAILTDEGSDRPDARTREGKRKGAERGERGYGPTELLCDVTTSLVEASSREEIDRAVCDRLAAVPDWQFAWIGDCGATSDRLSPRASAGDSGSYLDDVDVTVADDWSAEPAGRAAATGSTQTVEDVGGGLPVEGWRRRALDGGVRSVMSVPLVYEDVSYGVLTVYGETESAFDTRDRTAIETVGRAAAFACNALDRRTALVSDRATELDLRVPAEDGVLSLATRFDVPLDVDRIVPGDAGRLHVTVSVPETARVRMDAAAEGESVGSLSLVAERDDDLVYEGTVASDGLLGTVLEHAAVPKSVTPGEGAARVVVRLPPPTDVASFVGMLQSSYPGAELVARRTVERTTQSRHDFRSRLERDLTDRQWDAVETAFLSGYFEWPREQSGQEVGARLDISQPTFNRHLRDGLRKVLSSLFDEDDRVSESGE